MGETLRSLEEDAVGLLVQGGPVVYFFLLLAIFLGIAIVKAVGAYIDETAKDLVKKHAAASVTCVVISLFFIFTKHFFSAGLVVVVTAAWFVANAKFPARKVVTVCVGALLVMATYFGESWWVRKHGPRYTYVLLAFENAGVGDQNDRDIILQSWTRFGSILGEIFSDVPSIKVKPEFLNAKSFDSLSLEPRRTQVIESLEQGDPEKELILRTTVELESDEKVRAMKLVSVPQRLGSKNLIDMGVFIVKRAMLSDMDHLALSVASALVKELEPFEDFRLSPAEENSAIHKILLRYRSFLDRKDSSGAKQTSAEVEKLLLAPIISRDQANALLEAYTNPLLTNTEGEKDRLTRQVQLARFRAGRKPGVKQ